MKISAVAKRAGLAPSAIRYYEQAGLLPPPARNHGLREYSPAVLARLKVIEYAKACGFTLAEIRELVVQAGEPLSTRWRVMSARKLAELDELEQRIAEMRRLLHGVGRECRCADVVNCGRALQGTRQLETRI